MQDILALVADESLLHDASSIKANIDELNSVIHKLLHASSCVVLGRQHLHHLLRSHKHAAHKSMTNATLSRDACLELRWWLGQLRSPDLEGVPMASRRTFPAPGPGVLAPYFDASRELKSPASSGFGAWAVIEEKFCYVEGRWHDWELKTLSINVLELAARNIGTFTFLEYAEARGLRVSHLYEFTDNRAAELALEFGKPHTPEMQWLVQKSYDELKMLNIFNSMQRIASVDNDIADGLSRGGHMLANALRIVANAGVPIQRLPPSKKWRDLYGLQKFAE